MTDKERIEAIQRQLQQIDELNLVSETPSTEKFIRWREATKRLLKRIFGVESEQLKVFNSVYYSPWSITTNKVKQYQINQDAYLRGLNQTKVMLQVMIDELNERIQEEKTAPPRKMVSNKNKQLEIEVLDIELNGLLTELKTEISNLNLLKEREAKTSQYNADVSLYNAINDKKQKIEEIKAKISEVKTQVDELRKNNDELSQNELEILLTMQSERRRNPRTPRGIRSDTELDLEVVSETLSDLETKGLVAKSENRWDLTDKGKQLLKSITSQ